MRVFKYLFFTFRLDAFSGIHFKNLSCRLQKVHLTEHRFKKFTGLTQIKGHSNSPILTVRYFTGTTTVIGVSILSRAVSQQADQCSPQFFTAEYWCKLPGHKFANSIHPTYYSFACS